ncbi:MAG TPA: P22 phage major capsid protein family protein, partial [Ramlibacter sp.]|nr:P22 phage major capsid protein family protein [Ramlibacter sp.]
MANTILTPTAVTRKALQILHQKLNFVGSIVRDYDDSFAKSGAKIGDSLKVRLPNQYTVRSGATLSTQDTSESSVTLQVATQKGVDLNFSSAELTLSLDDFANRILDPAMSVLAANIEADAMSMYKDVAQSIWNGGSAATYNKALDARTILQRALAPTSERTANLNPLDMADLVKDTKTLFQDSSSIAKQYKEGFMGRAAGF